MATNVNKRHAPPVPANIAAKLNKTATQPVPASSSTVPNKNISLTAQRRLPPPPPPRLPPNYPRPVQVVTSATTVTPKSTPLPPPRQPAKTPTPPSTQKNSTQVVESEPQSMPQPMPRAVAQPETTPSVPPSPSTVPNNISSTAQRQVPRPPPPRRPPTSPRPDQAVTSATIITSKPALLSEMRKPQPVATSSVPASPVTNQNENRNLRVIGTSIVHISSPERAPHIELPPPPEKHFIPPSPSAPKQSEEPLEVVDGTQKKDFEEYVLDHSAQPQLMTAWVDDAQRIERSVKRTKAVDVVKGIYNSRLFKAVVVSTGFTLAAVFGVPALIASFVGLSALLALTPPGWIILGAAVTGLVIGYLLSSNKGTADKTEAGEIQIFDRDDPLNPSRLYVGSFPSRSNNEGEDLANNKHVGVVLSVNKPSERQLAAGRLPYRYEDWADLGIAYAPMDIDDSGLLTQRQLERGAQVINAHLSAGESVYVSGQAGRQAIIAYLLKYYPARSVAEAMDMAGESREDVKKVIEEYYAQMGAQRIYGK